MPYIPKQDRNAEKALTIGKLTYHLTMLCVDYLGGRYAFADLAEILGALEATKLELYRRVVVPYENAKLAESGDVYSDRPVSRPDDNASGDWDAWVEGGQPPPVT